MQPKIGFIGFGEAAFNIAKGLAGEGLAGIYAYDKFWNISPQSELVHKRAAEAKVTLAPSLKDLIESVEIIICSVSANLVVPLAKESLSWLKPGQIYVDLNSAGPDTKVEANDIISAKIPFVDVAVMGTVPGNGHKVPMLACGAGAKAFVEAMNPYGMNLTLLEGPAGKASASKMFRSIFMKGFVTLMLEAVIAGHKYGIEDDVLKSIEETLTAGDFKEIVNGMLTRGVIHSERREHEMDEVIATLKSLKIDSIMSEATKTKLKWVTDQKFKEYFKGVPPKDFHDIFAAMK
ncbi:NAD(P)-dependent oxidoreductase [Acetonema longum]|uniref:Phosphogluconate dehydrogenase, NAD-binding,-like protein n=1 Tax=Acetonema longum DSM 6540 TaxID=1009370 RepID=F7NJU5_9FIRM|nr:NAD(P)-dependent oxidoreductase [Acetonema longum]EGO63677.1 phosphogluconate dehydrogenase, NAD-binding, -like protein [Acetonema longum DSM 6540]